LPKEKIIDKLRYISEKEELSLSYKSLEKVQKLYKSDMRSMINFIQLCVQSNLKLEDEINIINDKICEDIEKKIIGDQLLEQKYLYEISLINNIEKNNLIKIIFNYIIKNKREKITPNFLNGKSKTDLAPTPNFILFSIIPFHIILLFFGVILECHIAGS